MEYRMTEVAARLGISRPAVFYHMKEGHITPIREDRHGWVFSAKSVAALRRHLLAWKRTQAFRGV